MSKQVYVTTIQPDPEGPVFGRVMQSIDFRKSQRFSHEHTEQVVRDLLVAGAADAQVAGFAAAVAGTLHVSVARGSVVDPNGISYDSESDDATVVALNAAHVTLPRIDLIYATLEADAQTNTEFRPFRRLRTSPEEEAGLQPYPQAQENVPTELHTRVTIGVKTGVANVAPAAPAVGAGEVALWQVHVAANQTILTNDDLTDVRALMESLYELSQKVSQAGLREIIEDAVGSFLGGSTSIVVTYDDAGNAESIALHTTYKSLLDGATANNTASTLVKRDASGHTRLEECKVDGGVRYMDDTSLTRSAFIRESFISILDVNDPVTFNGAVAGTYENLRRVAVNSATNVTGVPVVPIHPLFDCYVDPADFENANCLFEVYALHTGPNGGTSIWSSDIQLWNLTDGTQTAVLNFSWLDQGGGKRSSVFQLSGSGAKHMILRARNMVDVTDAYLKIWRARLIVNPSF